MTLLDDALAWYTTQESRLRSLQPLVKGSALAEPMLASLLQEFVLLRKAERIKRLQIERDELRRIAHVRLFSAFETEFRKAFAERLAKCGTGSAERLLASLPDSIRIILEMYRQLEPARISSALFNRVDNIRGMRNDLVHGAFDERLQPDEPREVHAALTQALAPLLVSVEQVEASKSSP